MSSIRSDVRARRQHPRRLAGVLLLLGAWLALASARAAAAPRTLPMDGVADAEADPGTIAVFDRALASYRAGQYDQAIVGFLSVYERTLEPALMFNVAQAYRLKGDCPRAIEAYRRYLMIAPTAENRGKIEDRLQELDAQCGPISSLIPPPRSVASPRVATGPLPPLPRPPPHDDSDPLPPTIDLNKVVEPATGAWRRPTALALAGGALLSAGVGTLYASRAMSAADRTSSLFMTGGDWSVAARMNESDGRRDGKWAAVGFTTAAVLAAVAAYLYITATEAELTGESSSSGQDHAGP